MRVATLRWLFFLLAPTSLWAQFHYTINAKILDDLVTVEGRVRVVGLNPFNRNLDTLFIQYWPAAYQKSSQLNQELIENQNIALHFSAANQAELFWLDANQTSYPIATETDHVGLILSEPLLPNDSIDLTLIFRYQLPDAAHNGFGKMGTEIRLAQWFPKIAPHDGNKFLNIPNNYHRLNHHQKNTIDGTLEVPKTHQCSCGQPTKTTENFNRFDFVSQTAGDWALVCSPQTYALSSSNQRIKLVLNNQLPPTFDWEASVNRVIKFWETYTGLSWSAPLTVALLNDLGKLESTPEILFVKNPKKAELFEIELIGTFTRAYLEHHKAMSSFEMPWFVMGFSAYMASNYAQKERPNLGFLGPLDKTWLAKFLKLRQYPYDYEKQLFYHYMARLGVDQPMEGDATQFNKANYLAVIQGKSAMAFRYLEDYVSPKNYRRGVQRWMIDTLAVDTNHKAFVASQQYFHNKPLDWWGDTLIPAFGKIDYAITQISRCSYTFGVRVKNKGQVQTPFSITGYKNGEPLITLWYDGFEGEKLLPFHLEDYDYVAIDHQQRMPEINARNNFRRTHGLWRSKRPFQLQLIGSVEDPMRTQIFWMPNIDFNAYDQILIGLSLHNITPVPKKFEYQLIPEYSTGTGKLMGYGSLQYRWTPEKGPFHLIYFSLFARYNHYAENLTFTRLSPSIGAYFRKPHPRDENIHKIRLRAVILDRQTPEAFENSSQNAFDLSRASYAIADLKYLWEHVNILRPYTLEVDLQTSALFSRLAVTSDKRWMLPNKKWLIWRGFAGAFLNNTANTTSFYSFGLSGTRDYLFDYALLGRTDLDGLWSRQFFVTDGGFKTSTNLFANQWMATTSVSIPIWKWFGVFGDIGMMDNFNTVYWDYGIRVSLLSDFFELYFPIQNHQTNFLMEAGYFNHTRFILNIKTSEIIQRLRRGYY